MAGRFMNGLVKATAYLPQMFIFRLKFHYEDKNVQSRKIKGPAIIVSNHTSVYDYAADIFVFPGRTLRFQMAEVLFKKKLQGWFLKCMGGIIVNRNAADYSYISKSKEILSKKGVVGVFPEGRLPRPGEERPISFKPGVALLALESGVPVIPIYTTGGYWEKKDSHVIIGKPVYATDYLVEGASAKDNLQNIASGLRQKVIELGELYGKG
ncbi:MAG: 1-acyl-sn-glycerol-3-phosphate acyltransferase [Lachnospiraceae bacterium]|nr:1-acyl-sn-glycerol-3-phosphate acyltransferase [Candidatus Merdinaster equi]